MASDDLCTRIFICIDVRVDVYLCLERVEPQKRGKAEAGAE